MSIAASRRWTNLLRLIGVHPSWHTTTLPRAEIVAKVGDALFMGLWKFLAVYFIATFLVLLVLIQVSGTAPLGMQKPSVVAALWTTSALARSAGLSLDQQAASATCS